MERTKKDLNVIGSMKENNKRDSECMWKLKWNNKRDFEHIQNCQGKIKKCIWKQQGKEQKKLWIECWGIMERTEGRFQMYGSTGLG
jgi:hypothetical protein